MMFYNLVCYAFAKVNHGKENGVKSFYTGSWNHSLCTTPLVKAVIPNRGALKKC